VFRRAQSVGNDKGLAEFCLREYTRLRKNKKSTNVTVYNTLDGYYTIKSHEGNEVIGSLRQLKEVAGESYFESITSGPNGKMRYEIGKESRLTIEEVDWSSAECSAGLHCHNGKYSDEGYGDTRLACALVPSMVVHCPYNDQSKMRVLALTPVQILTKDFKMTSEIEEILDVLYEDEIGKLQEMLDTMDFKEYNKHNLNVNLPDFQYIVKTIVEDSVVKERYTKL
jgi:hypothetical protein